MPLERHGEESSQSGGVLAVLPGGGGRFCSVRHKRPVRSSRNSSRSMRWRAAEMWRHGFQFGSPKNGHRPLRLPENQPEIPSRRRQPLRSCWQVLMCFAFLVLFLFSRGLQKLSVVCYHKGCKGPDQVTLNLWFGFEPLVLVGGGETTDAAPATKSMFDWRVASAGHPRT